MIDFLTAIESEQKIINNKMKSIEVLRDIKNANFPYVFPYEDLSIRYFSVWENTVDLYFNFKNELTLDEKENFAINFIDELGGCPQSHAYGGSELPNYCVSTHKEIELNGYFVNMLFYLGNILPESYDIRIIDKARTERVCEVYCKNQ